MRFSLLALALCVGCATTGGVPGPSAAATTPEVVTDGHGNVIRTVDAAASVSINAAPADVQRALVAAYESVGLAPDIVDPTSQVVSRSAVAFSRTLQGERLSSLFDCGQGQFGPRADDGRVTVVMTSRVAGSAAPVRVNTQVDASVVSNEGASTGRVRCGSRGILEERIRRAVFTQLGLPDPRPY
jgi:hypothetical protein